MKALEILLNVFIFLCTIYNIVNIFIERRNKKKWVNFHKKYNSHLRNVADYINQLKEFAFKYDYVGFEICNEQVEKEIETLNKLVKYRDV